MIKYSYDLFTMISEYCSPIPKYSRCSIILLFMCSKKKNYFSVKELQADYEEMHLSNNVVTPELLLTFSEAMKYLLKRNIILLNESGLELNEEQCLLFLLDNTNTTQMNPLN